MDRINKHLKDLLLIAFICISYDCYAGSWISLDGERPGKDMSIEVIQSDTSTYKVRIKLFGIHESIVKHQGTEYHKLFLDEGGVLDDIGAPALPVVCQLIGLPSGSDAKVSIEERKWVDVDMDRIFPAQKPYSKEEENVPFIVTDSIYLSDFFDVPQVTLSERNYWKGIGNVYVRVCPFKYYPVSKRLSVLSDFVLQVDFAPIREEPLEKQTYKQSDLSLFDNYGFLPTSVEEPTRDQPVFAPVAPDYLIIVGNMPSVENCQAMTDFRRWKALKGYSTKVVSTSTIGSDSASIKNYISQEYINGISQVLFVGDHTKIPLANLAPFYPDTVYSVLKSDYWYGCMGGTSDYEADLPIGRFVAANENDFYNMVHKTINYESLPNTWANKSLLFANMQQNNLANYQAAMEQVRTASYIHPLSFYTAYAASVDSGGNGATKYDVFDYINGGMNIVAYNGHGNPHEMYMNYSVPNPNGITY